MAESRSVPQAACITSKGPAETASVNTRGKLVVRSDPATLSVRRRYCAPARRFSRERFFGVRFSDHTTQEWRPARFGSLP